MFDKEINEIPEYEMVPGTVQLVDVTGTLEVEKNGDKSISFCNHRLRKILTIHCAGANGKEESSFSCCLFGLSFNHQHPTSLDRCTMHLLKLWM